MEDFDHNRHDGWDGPDRRDASRRDSYISEERRYENKRGVKFDATINLGHILTFLGFLIAGFGAWTTLDKRVLVIEERAATQAVVDRNQDNTLAANTGQIKESLLEIKAQINRIAERRSTP